MVTRKKELDMARGIGMFLVVFAHIYSKQNSLINTFIGTFDMPLFFFLSGLLFKPYASLAEGFRKKVLQLVVPYFIWGGISFLYWWLIERSLRADTIELSLYDGIKGVFVASYPLIIYNAVLWFLPVLFIIEVLFLVTYRSSNNSKVQNYITLTVVLICAITSCLFSLPELPWGINRVLKFIIFYYAGFILRNWDYHKYNFKILTVVAGLGINCLFIYFGLQKNFYDYVLGIVGSVAILLLCDCLINYVKCKVGFSIMHSIIYLGSNTMIVYILHGPLYRIVIGILMRVFTINSNYLRESIIFTVLIALFVIAILLLASSLISRVAPVMIGKKGSRLRNIE